MFVSAHAQNLGAMNFNIDCKDKKHPGLQRVVPLLVLAKEWGNLGKDAFDQTDIVLLLLQGIRHADDEKVRAL